METVQFELGSYTGHLQAGVPHGLGQMVYKQDDPLDREIYDGNWLEGYHGGLGSMKFKSGEIYSGEFHDNLPHGKGEFLYPTGDKEEVKMEGGVRHGQSRYTSVEDGTVEEVVFSEGEPSGPSKVSQSLTLSWCKTNCPLLVIVSRRQL